MHLIKNKRTVVLCALCWFTSSLIFSQSARDSVQLDEVVVTGTKKEIARKLVPLSVSQISRTDIENSGQINILPALNSFAPGIFVTERNILGFGVAAGGSGAISIRGISSAPNTSVLVLIDGHPQYQGIFGHPLADAYVASDVEKVEIIRGPASILYGSNAMAGVINIITKKQAQEGLKMSAGASYGSFNTQKYYGTIGFKKDKLSAFASVNHDRTDGIRANTDFKISNGYAKAGYEINNNLTVSADFSIAKYDANDNGPITAPAPFGIDITRGKTSVSVDNKFDNSEGSIKLYHNFGMHDLSDGFLSTDRNSGVMIYQSYKLGRGTTITAGTDFKQFGGTANRGVKADSLILINELAVYAYAQHTLFEKLALSAGLRLENNSVFGSELVPIGGITWNYSDNTTFKTSVSKGFRSPTMMELYLYAPNPDLQPERMMNYELSWLQSLINNRLKLELTGFRVIGENMIQVVLPPPPPAKRQNVGSFDNKGIEFSARYIVSQNLHFNANYSYVDLKKAVIAAPRQQLNLGSHYNYKIWGVHLSSQYIEKLYTQVSPNPVIENGYFLLNARLTAKPIKNLEIFVAGNNLMDSRYQINYGYPMPGINFNAGFNAKF